MEIIEIINGNEIPITKIEDLVAFFLSNKKNIENLYYNHDKAINFSSQIKFLCFVFSQNNLGKTTYTGKQLLYLECLSKKESLSSLCNPITLDNYVKILFKYRKQIQVLLQGENKAIYMRSNIKLFCFIFKNFLKGCIQSLDQDYITLTGNDILNIECKALKRKFIIKSNIL